MKERGIIFGGESVRAILAGRKTQFRRPLSPQPILLEEGGSWSWHCDTKDKWDYTIRNDDNFSFRNGTANGMWRCPFSRGDGRHVNYGDRLWVKEAFTFFETSDGKDGIAYRATCPDDSFTYAGDDGSVEEIKILRWSSPRRMVRAHSRITLEVTEVRVEQLGLISEADAIAEGITIPIGETPCPCEGDEEEPAPHVPWCAWRDPDVDPDPVFDVGLPRAVTEFAIQWNKAHPKARWSSSPWCWVVSFRRVEAGA